MHTETEKDYNGFVIEATPFQLIDTGKWTCDIVVWKDMPNSSLDMPFSASNIYDSREEAIVAGFQFGKAIIDGRINCGGG